MSFKPLSKNNVKVRPFLAKKEWSLVNTDVNSGVYVYKGYRPTTASLVFADTNLTTSNAEFAHLMFSSIDHLYYEYKYRGYDTFGIFTTQSIHKELYDTCSIFSIPQSYYGERISSGSFSIENAGTTLKDDGYGNLYNEVDETNFYATKSVYTLGNIFYHHGLAVITANDTASQDFATSSYIISFKSEHKIYEYEINCEVKAGDFNWTTNPSILVSGSGWVGGSTSGTLVYNEVTASILSSSEWTPYITTVGLYDDVGNLVAVGKLGRPIKNEKFTTKQIIVRLDF